LTDPSQVVAEYIDGVMSGEIVTGRLVKLAVRRHLDDMEHAAARGYYFDERIAAEACGFFPDVLRHSKGAKFSGKQFVLSPFQAFLTSAITGWRRASDNTRRFRKAYVTTARKQGKSTYAAGLGLYLLTCDNPIEPGAEVYVAATKEDQACIMFHEAQNMVAKSPSLTRMSEVVKKNIAIPSLTSFMRPLGSDSKTNAGWNPHAMLLDEVCDWQEHHRELWGALTTAGGSRTQPLRLVTCTAGNETSDIWQEEDDYAVAVVESVLTGNVIDDEYFAFIARLDEARACEDCHGEGCDLCEEGTIPADDPFDESCWCKANPNLDVSITVDYLRGQATEAKNKPAAKNHYMRYHMNTKVTRSFKVIDTSSWGWRAGACELSDWKGQSVYGAFDLGWSNDLASIALVTKFFDGEDDEHNDRWRYECRSWSFLCEECEQDLTREPWQRFIEDGCLTITSGAVTDIPGAFKRKILEVSEEFGVAQWAHDTAGALHLAIELSEEFGIECFKFPQSFGFYNPSFQLFLDLVKGGLFVHGGDRLLEWTARNLIAKSDHRGLIMPDKKKSKEKIDPMTATIMAIGGAMKSVESRPWNPADGVSL